MRVVGEYEIGETLGRGGTSVVYLARHRVTGREVALKELWLGGPAADPDAALRFVRETRLAARLNHPNIVAVYDAFEQDGAPYMAMEYLRQGSLKPRIGHLSPAQIIGVLEGLLAALDHAEQHAIVHRDIKPANLLVADSGAVKVADFGIAKTGALDAFGTITVTGTTLGTPQYMAPEQALGRRLTPAADRYSAGVLAYELLAGFTPFFDIEEPMAVMQSHINQPPASVIEVDEGVDPALSRWVDALLAKDPAARPRSAAAAWESLERVAIDRLGPAWRDAASLVEGAGPLAPAPFTRSDDARTVSLDTAGDTPRAATAVRGIKGPGPLIPLGGLLRPPVLLALVLVLAFVAIELRNTLDKSDGTTVGANATSAHVTDIIEVGSSPDGVAVGAGAVWTVTKRDGDLRRIDPGAHEVTATVKTGALPDSVVTDGGAVYVTTQGADDLVRFNTEPSLRQVARLPVGPQPESMAVGDNYVWVVLSEENAVQRVDRDTGKLVGKRVPVGDTPIGIDVNQHRLWVTNAGDGTVTLRREGAQVTTIPVGQNPRDVLEAFGYAWVVLTDENAVVRIDATTGRRVGDPIRVGPKPHKIAATDSALWVTNAGDGTVSEIDPRRFDEVARIEVGARPLGIAAGEGAVWVGNAGDRTVTRIEP